MNEEERSHIGRALWEIISRNDWKLCAARAKGSVGIKFIGTGGKAVWFGFKPDDVEKLIEDLIRMCSAARAIHAASKKSLSYSTQSTAVRRNPAAPGAIS